MESGWNTGMCRGEGMSFRRNKETSQKVSTARHCQIAELAAIMGMCGGVVITSGDRYQVKIQTDSLPVARKCFTLLQKIFNIEPEISIRQHQKPQKTRIYTIWYQDMRMLCVCSRH